MKKIVFVCTGNTCRSSMAEALFKKMLADKGKSKEFTVSSCGTHAIFGLSASENAIKAMKEEGVDLSSHKSRPLTEDILTADLVLTMTLSQKEYILSRFPEMRGRVFTLGEYAGDGREIPDPIGMNADFYKMVAGEIKAKLQKIITKL